MRRMTLLLLLLAAALCAQILIATLADITGDGAAHPLASSPTQARWVQVVALPGNSAVVRIGDSQVGIARGVPIAAGGGLMLPPPNSAFPSYDLSQIYYYAASGDKVCVTYAH